MCLSQNLTYNVVNSVLELFVDAFVSVPRSYQSPLLVFDDMRKSIKRQCLIYYSSSTLRRARERLVKQVGGEFRFGRIAKRVSDVD